MEEIEAIMESHSFPSRMHRNYDATTFRVCSQLLGLETTLWGEAQGSYH